MIKYILIALLIGCSHASALRAGELADYAARQELVHQLPAGLLQAVCEQESRWRNVAGRHGEIGVCQIKPSTVEMIAPGYYPRRAQMYSIGVKGDNVARIQAVLARKEYYNVAIDGIFGSATYRAVVSYQSDRRLAVDGIVGPRTWAALFPEEPFPGESVGTALWSPTRNIEWAARILKWCEAELADMVTVNLMLGCYNGGLGHPVIRYIRQVRTRMSRINQELTGPVVHRCWDGPDALDVVYCGSNKFGKGQRSEQKRNSMVGGTVGR